VWTRVSGCRPSSSLPVIANPVEASVALFTLVATILVANERNVQPGSNAASVIQPLIQAWHLVKA